MLSHAALLVTLAAAPPQARWWGEREEVTTGRALLVYARGDLDADEARAFARLLDQGVTDVESVVSSGLPPGTAEPPRVRFVVTPRVGISRAFRSTVLLPLGRVRARSAPYLHEITHVLVPSRSDCTWLTEGLASYIESRVAETLGGYDAHVFTRGGNAGIDAAARRRLRGPRAADLLAYVGGSGQPPDLDADRSGVARPFYVLSQSFVKFLADRAGVDAVVAAAASADPPRVLAARTGRPVEAWKAEWLAWLRAPAS
jgi:hypothetical protein